MADAIDVDSDGGGIVDVNLPLEEAQLEHLVKVGTEAQILTALARLVMFLDSEGA